MESLTLDLPAMYGDHHVTEVRKILLAIPGVTDVYASSAFQVVTATYDPVRTDASTIRARLGEAGYLEDLATPHETDEAAVSPDEHAPFFRHATGYPQTGRVVSFAQHVGSTARSLWPCPGIETVKAMEGKDGEERT
jgi:copper chaperone CopZ